MRVISIGISESAGQTAPPPTPYDELNTDWTTESAPSEWFHADGTDVYAPEGMYNTSLIAYSLDQITCDTDPTFGTIIIAIDTFNATDNYFALAMGAMNIQGNYDDDTDLLAMYWLYNDNNNQITSSGAAIGTPFVAALTTDAAGNIEAYYIDENGTQVTSDTATPPSVDPASVQLQMFASADAGSTMGTPGDMAVTHTYFKVDDTLTQSEIEAIALAWGIGPAPAGLTYIDDANQVSGGFVADIVQALVPCNDGDLRIVMTTQIDGAPVTLPAGWTLIDDYTETTGNVYIMQIFVRVKQPGDTDADITITTDHTSVANGSCYAFAATADTTADAATGDVLSYSSAYFTIPSMTLAADAYGVCVACCFANAPSGTWDTDTAGWTLLSQLVSNSGFQTSVALFVTDSLQSAGTLASPNVRITGAGGSGTDRKGAILFSLTP